MRLILRLWKQEGWTGSTKNYDLSNLTTDEYNEVQMALMDTAKRFLVRSVKSVHMTDRKIEIGQIIMEEALDV